MAGVPSWTPGRRAACAVAAAVVVVLAAVLMRPAPEQNRPHAVATAGGMRGAVPRPQDRAVPVGGERQVAVTVSRVRRVARQLVDDTPAVEPIVEIDPVAIVPLQDGDARENTLLSQRVEIAPIDVEQVSISQLEQVE